MPERTQNVYQLVLTKAITSHRRNKMFRYMCWPKPSGSERIQNVIPHVLTKPLPPQRWQKMHLNMSWHKPSHASEDIKCISTCLTKTLLCQEDTKFITTCIDQTHPMPARTQNISQHVLNKHKICQRGQKIHLNMYWPNHSHPCEDTKSISTYVEQTHRLIVKALNCVKQIHPMKQENGKCIWTCVEENHPDACEDTKCISTCVDQTSPMKTKNTKCISTWDDKILPWLRGPNMHLNLYWPKSSMSARTKNLTQHVLTKALQAIEVGKCLSTWVD
jgi:hypothetical protein